MCGNLPSKKVIINGQETEELPHRYSVPLGTFAVSNLTNITAAVGLKIPDVNPQDALFKPIFTASDGALEQIQAFNEQYASRPTAISA